MRGRQGTLSSSFSGKAPCLEAGRCNKCIIIKVRPGSQFEAGTVRSRDAGNCGCPAARPACPRHGPRALRHLCRPCSHRRQTGKDALWRLPLTLCRANKRLISVRVDTPSAEKIWGCGQLQDAGSTWAPRLVGPERAGIKRASACLQRQQEARARLIRDFIRTENTERQLSTADDP